MVERKARRTGIYFILAPSHHGKATLSAILSLHEGILCLGDTNPSRDADQPCSCGEMVSTCPFWMRIKADTFYADDDPLSSILPQLPLFSKNEKLNRAINSGMALCAGVLGPKVWRIMYEPAETYFAIHKRFLASCQKQSPHTVFVDGENSCLKFMVMASMRFPVRGVIHLTRDPRGYAAAVKRHYPEIPVEKHGLEWSAAHTRICKALGPFSKIPAMRLKYEDLSGARAESLKQINRFMRLSPLPDRILEGDLRSSNKSGHMIGDAVAILKRGVVDPGCAENWRQELTSDEQKRVLAAAGPLFSDFGYKS